MIIIGNIDLGDEVTEDDELLIDSSGEEYINRNEAIRVVKHLIDVFDISEMEIV